MLSQGLASIYPICSDAVLRDERAALGETFELKLSPGHLNLIVSTGGFLQDLDKYLLP